MQSRNKSKFKILDGTQHLIDWEIRTNVNDELQIIDKMIGGGEIYIAHDDFYEWFFISEFITDYLYNLKVLLIV